MTTVFVTAIDIANYSRVSTDASNVDYHITSDGVFGSTEGYVLQLRGSDHNVIVEGTVSGAGIGIILGDGLGPLGNPDLDNSVHVAEGGLVQGAAGVMLWATGRVSNSGEIAGVGSGISLIGVANTRAAVVNDGLVSAKDFGILTSLSGTSSATIVNTGLVTATFAGLYAVGSAGNIQRVTNHGTISGDWASYESFDIIDLLTNRGEMRGDIRLGKGNDLYDGRGGRIVDGAVLGQDGDDRFMPGDGAEDFDGGAGIDTLDFRSSAGLRVSLVDDSGSGAALGDSYAGIERVLGSRFGADLLIGDGAGNTLEGFGGADQLRGGAGGDRLVGGAEADRLWGGAGNDLFVFAAIEHGGDAIADWGTAAGNDDAFQVEVAGFGAGLSAGALAASRFVARLSDSLAQDADDRFVFRKDNATLWFDADGKGGGAAVLLADLQAGAVVTAADILLV